MGRFGFLVPRALVISAFLLFSVVHDVLARPDDENSLRRQPGNHYPAPKANVWGELADYEAAAVVRWLFAQEDLNLTISEDATEWDNTMPLVEAMWPNKTDALAYLDRNATRPASEWLYKISASITDITPDLWNGTALGLDNDTIDIWGIEPLWQDDDVTGRDVSKWKLEGWFYNNVFYETTDAFREAYWREGFVKNPPNVDRIWASTDQLGSVHPMDTAHPPILVAPGASRFAVDRQQKYVDWMDYSFYIGFTRDTGLALYDIRYKGERLLYELSLQEVLAHYAGNDPMNSGTACLDTFYGFGLYTFELVKGYDCPAHSVYLNTSFYVAETINTHIDSVCLFEYVSDYPIQRHTINRYVSATKNIYFVVRAVATVGNYDYSFSYTFFMDGSISVDVRASGYIQSAYFAHDQDYGFRIQSALSGSMHDHVLNFKADLDILGTANSAQLMTMIPTTKICPWSRGPKPRNAMALTRMFILSESASRLNWPPNAATQLPIVNEQRPNRYGELRGYRILPSTPPAHLTVLDSTNLANAARWAAHDVQITRRKDTEPRASHPLNSQDVHDPPVDFDAFFDAESLRNEDLVVWLNLGMHHVPHTGDLPNTVMTTARAGVVFTPSNYFDGRDESRRTVNQVRVGYGGGGGPAEVTRFGQFNDGNGTMCTLAFEPVAEDLEGYTGDVIAREVPYDPSRAVWE
ncbi:Amine oxidase [Madurella fahalii]|uniref:Amine oxidase n=1 Tax=Madurella fahalii TaxID=1157608 RepID=A0ABQ0GHZ1_9PEZI